MELPIADYISCPAIFEPKIKPKASRNPQDQLYENIDDRIPVECRGDRTNTVNSSFCPRVLPKRVRCHLLSQFPLRYPFLISYICQLVSVQSRADYC